MWLRAKDTNHLQTKELSLKNIDIIDIYAFARLEMIIDTKIAKINYVTVYCSIKSHTFLNFKYREHRK